MKSKSFSLKNLTSYFNPTEEDSKLDKKFVLPKISSFVPSINLHRKESKIELNRKLTFFVDKSFGKTLQKTEENESSLENLKKAPRNNFNSNFQDRVLLKKEVPKAPVFNKKMPLKKKLGALVCSKPSMNVQRGNSNKILARKNTSSSEYSMNIPYKKGGVIDGDSPGKTCKLSNPINDYFDKIIKEFKLEETIPSTNEEINIFDLYLDSQLNTLTD